jgi:7,8-dihydropterin-6-yl-methyl-4-(beta-D-ribofuranosyl)aminobenzene 5'-phosphate synthase
MGSLDRAVLKRAGYDVRINPEPAIISDQAFTTGVIPLNSFERAGVLNSVRRAQAVSGISKVHAVVGGFHLVRPRTDDEARRTVAEFIKIDPTYRIPMHCTGEVFIAEALRLMPEKIVRSYVGTKFVFNANEPSSAV